MHNALYCNEKVRVRGCIMHNGGIPDRVIADTIDILPLLTALSGNTIRSNPMKCKKAQKKELQSKPMYLQNISQQPAFCVALQTILVHLQFPSLCNAVTLMRNASQPIEFNLIKSQRFNLEISFLHNICYMSHSMFRLKDFVVL